VPKSDASDRQRTVQPAAAPTRTCQLYGSSSSFGLLCSDAVAGKPLAQSLSEAGVVFGSDGEFCWDDPDLPDGFLSPDPAKGPAWFLHTCLTFAGGPIVSSNAQVSYAFEHREPGTETTLTGPQQTVIDSVLGRGRIPFLPVQTSPTGSPRVGQDVAFSALCGDARLECSGAAQGRIETNRLAVGGITMWAELVHLQVEPLGAGSPERIGCTGAGLARTAEQLDATDDDPRVCRYAYDRSSNGAGAGERGDRYPSQVTAFWQIWFDRGTGPERLGATYEKTTVNQIRVTEVQTLVVS